MKLISISQANRLISLRKKHAPYSVESEDDVAFVLALLDEAQAAEDKARNEASRLKFPDTSGL